MIMQDEHGIIYYKDWGRDSERERERGTMVLSIEIARKKEEDFVTQEKEIIKSVSFQPKQI